MAHTVINRVLPCRLMMKPFIQVMAKLETSSDFPALRLAKSPETVNRLRCISNSVNDGADNVTHSSSISPTSRLNKHHHRIMHKCLQLSEILIRDSTITRSGLLEPLDLLGNTVDSIKHSPHFALSCTIFSILDA
jgi:hypothetical protein